MENNYVREKGWKRGQARIIFGQPPFFLLCEPRNQLGYAINRISNSKSVGKPDRFWKPVRFFREDTKLSPLSHAAHLAIISISHPIAKLNAGYSKGCIPRLLWHKQ